MGGKRKTEDSAEAPRRNRLVDLRDGLPRLGYRLLTRLVLPILVPVIVLGIGFSALYALQATLREHAAPVPISFADIQCDSPPGLPREDFLQQVQCWPGGNEIPDTLDLLDGSLAPRLTAAFRRHPWVESVERITPTPERRLRVGLVFRVPVLAVPDGERFRAVDRRGVLLPEKAYTPDLPRYEGRTPIPPVKLGTVWPDQRITACASVAALLRPHQDRVPLEKLTCEDRAVLLWTAWGEKITWGSPPGVELRGEAHADRKLERLLGRSLDATDLDLRR
jgi:hypothetical protein